MVKDINPGGSSSPSRLISVDSTLFFRADDGSHGRELWKSDGTSIGTVLVKDIYPGPGSFTEGGPGPGNSLPVLLTNANGTLFFAASDGTHGRELWKSDGTSAGTVLVKDIYPGSGGSFLVPTTPPNTPKGGYIGPGSSLPASLTVVNGTLFFAADDGIQGRELWKSDGTADGTVLVKDVYPGPGSSLPAGLANVNGTLFFAASDGTHGRELWKARSPVH